MFSLLLLSAAAVMLTVVTLCIVAKIKKETGVSIRVPSDDSSDGVVRIEGSPEGVAHAKQQLMEMVSKMVRIVCKLHHVKK